MYLREERRRGVLVCARPTLFVSLSSSLLALPCVEGAVRQEGEELNEEGCGPCACARRGARAGGGRGETREAGVRVACVYERRRRTVLLLLLNVGVDVADAARSACGCRRGQRVRRLRAGRAACCCFCRSCCGGPHAAMPALPALPRR